MQRFYRYGLIGVGNTAVHWLLFFLLHGCAGWYQAPSNIIAFAVAASLSYCLNAHFTFGSRTNGSRYLIFVAGMGALSFVVGAFSDWAALSPWLTLVIFSAVSLVAGYWFSQAVVFRRNTP
nr:GtrA family protein [Pantoea sp. Tr-811]